jgi:hypothetical protein
LEVNIFTGWNLKEKNTAKRNIKPLKYGTADMTLTCDPECTHSQLFWLRPILTTLATRCMDGYLFIHEFQPRSS